MKNRNRVDKVVAEKIIEYCAKVESVMQRFGETFETFNNDEAYQLAVGMCVVQIGELTNRFSAAFKEEHKEIEWHAIKAMRNIFVHDYEQIDLERVWIELSADIPELKARMEKILAAEATNDGTGQHED